MSPFCLCNVNIEHSNISNLSNSGENWQTIEHNLAEIWPTPDKFDEFRAAFQTVRRDFLRNFGLDPVQDAEVENVPCQRPPRGSFAIHIFDTHSFTEGLEKPSI